MDIINTPSSIFYPANREDVKLDSVFEEEIREQEKEKRHTIFVIIALIIIIFATLLL